MKTDTMSLIDTVRCPTCGDRVMLHDDRVMRCLGPRTHCFDMAAEGYVNLNAAAHTKGDTPDAVRARTSFLNTGAYEPIARAVADALRKYVAPLATVLDAGCGEGYYSCYLARNDYSVCGVDLSKTGVRTAAKRAKHEGLRQTQFIVGNLNRLPLGDECFDAAVNIFAPCMESELTRILKPGGVLCVVYAGPEHLLGLKQRLYQQIYLNEERADMPKSMVCAETVPVTYEILVKGHEQIMNLFSMTPYYWRTSPHDRKMLEHAEELSSAVDVRIGIYKKL